MDEDERESLLIKLGINKVINKFFIFIYTVRNNWNIFARNLFENNSEYYIKNFSCLAIFKISLSVPLNISIW